MYNAKIKTNYDNNNNNDKNNNNDNCAYKL